jgi:hypothetical protein
VDLISKLYHYYYCNNKEMGPLGGQQFKTVEIPHSSLQRGLQEADQGQDGEVVVLYRQTTRRDSRHEGMMAWTAAEGPAMSTVSIRTAAEDDFEQMWEIFQVK